MDEGGNLDKARKQIEKNISKKTESLTPEEMNARGEDYFDAWKHAKAVEWYRRAANQGDANAQCNLGFCYLSGKGVKRNVGLAIEWYRKAAEQGDVKSQYSMGNMYFEGRDVKQDDGLAVKWYQKAADQGEVRAQSNLGTMYIHGRGVQQNLML